MTTFPRVSQRSIWRSGDLTSPTNTQSKVRGGAGTLESQRCTLYPSNCGLQYNMSTTFSPHQTSKPRMRRRLWENSAVQRPALAFSQIFTTLRRGDAGRLDGVFRFIQSGWSAAKLRKHAESYALPKGTSSPQNSATQILLSNTIVWPLPSLHPCTFVLLSRLAPQKRSLRSSHGNGLSWVKATRHCQFDSMKGQKF